MEYFTSTEILTDKILIDLNNFEIPEDFRFLPIDESLAKKLASEVPNARVVKAFNTIPLQLTMNTLPFPYFHQISILLDTCVKQSGSTV